ncbi:flagellar assembly protein FliH [Caloramator quimbayensis]|uniref:Flagellar assembly protein FliH n=1 Tax=Caloramator quimbayensis TaxID=1147123 RepID=A0A1T4X9R6_9CLOT|nr:FliH/SctL family protein [Caloramator quimbayensis]SKA86352.1 flagellar assembly protein FliH [Caloramator quimbayensis]
MQSSYKVIKATKVQNDFVITTPTIENFYNSMMKDEERDFNIDDIKNAIKKEIDDEKEKILSQSKNQAQVIIEEAKIKAKEIYEKAKDEGFQEGYKEGYSKGYDFGINEAQKETEGKRKDAECYVKESYEKTRQFIKEFEKEIISLSVEIAKSVIKSELVINSNAVFKIAESIISKSVDKKLIMLKVNPLDLNVLKDRREELSLYVEDSNNLIIIGDNTIEQGNIVAETKSGFIDGSIDTQLSIILKSLSEAKYDKD